MNKVFISYSHSDTDFVNRFAADLQASGLAIWIDHESIHAGDTWTGSISDGIEQCDIFIVVLSPISSESRNVVKEVILADENKKPIFPVFCAACVVSRDMRYPLAGKQYLNLEGGENYSQNLPRLVAATRATQTDPHAISTPHIPAPAQTRQPTQPPPFPRLDGAWQVQFQNPMTGLSGGGQIMLAPSGQFQATLTSQQGMANAAGLWQFINGQLTLQGNWSYVQFPYNQLPYGLLMVVSTYTQNTINFTASTGDYIIWQRP